MTIEEKLKMAIESLEFYADRKNWLDTFKSTRPNYRITKMADCERLENSTRGGNIARTTLEIIGVNE